MKQQSTGRPSSVVQIEALFAGWDQPDGPGCAIGIIDHGRLALGRGFGSANLDYQIPNTTRTLFDIASTSKQFTAMCAALMIEDGRLALDDDSRRYLPDLPDFGEPVRISHLIYHTSGWPDYLELMEQGGHTDEDAASDASILDLLKNQPRLDFPPGERYAYSNTGYFLLGLILAAIAGQSLAELAAATIFRPLGMKRTRFLDNQRLPVGGRATGYTTDESGRHLIYMTRLNAVGDGGLLTSVEDLLLWDRNFYHNRLGRPELLDLVLRPGRLNNGEAIPYGFGLELTPYRELACVSHAGWFVGYRAELMRLPEQQVTLICLCNTDQLNPIEQCRSMAGIWLEDRLGPPQAKGNT